MVSLAAKRSFELVQLAEQQKQLIGGRPMSDLPVQMFVWAIFPNEFMKYFVGKLNISVKVSAWSQVSVQERRELRLRGFMVPNNREKRCF